MGCDYAVIAGGGKLPLQLIEKLKEKGKEILVFAIKKEFIGLDPSPFVVHEFDVGKLSTLKELLESYSPKNITVIGSIDRKNHWISPIDGQNLKLGLKFFRDRDILSAFIAWLEDFPITLISPHWFFKDLKSKLKPVEYQSLSAASQKHLRFFKDIAWADLGQVVVAQRDRILGVEGPEGTDECIRRAVSHCKGPLEVFKFPKVDQDLRIDMPTLGLQTLKCLEGRKKSKVYFAYDGTLIVDENEVIPFAKKEGIELIPVKKLPWQYKLGEKPLF